MLKRLFIYVLLSLTGGYMIGGAIKNYKNEKYTACGVNIMLSISEITMMILSMIKWHF